MTTEGQSQLYHFTTLQMNPAVQGALSPHKFLTLPNLFKVDSQPETTEGHPKQPSPHKGSLSLYKSNRDAQHTEAHILSAAQLRAKKTKRNVESRYGATYTQQRTRGVF